MPMTMATATAAMMPRNSGVLSGASASSGYSGYVGSGPTPRAVSAYEP